MQRIRILVICALILSGCTSTYLPPSPLRLSNTGLYQATDDSQMAIAIDAQGVKHIARTECLISGGNGCRVIYQAIPSAGESQSRTYMPTSGHNLINPDVAVTDSGVVIVAWQDCPAGDPFTTRACHTQYVRNDNLLSIIELDNDDHSLTGPLLVSRGEVIYAVVEVAYAASGSALRYCRVSDLRHSCYWASEDPSDGVRHRDAAAAVSGDGSLLVSWLQTDVGGVTVYTNSNYGDVDEDMHQQAPRLGATNLSAPAVAIETDNDNAYMAVAMLTATSDQIVVFYGLVSSYLGGGGMKLADMPSALAWDITGKPSMAAGVDNMTTAFAAKNTNHPTQTDVYWFDYQFGAAASPLPARPYPTTLPTGVYPCDLRVAKMTGWSVLGWHTCAFPPTRGDVYFYSQPTGGRLIHSVTDYAGRGGADMATNGEFVAGVWNEIQTDGRVATWLAFNTHLVYLPMVKK